MNMAQATAPVLCELAGRIRDNDGSFVEV